MAVVNELVTKFTFIGNLAPLDEFQEGLKTSIIGIAKFAAVGIAAATAVGVWANSTLRGAESLIRLADDTGIAVEELQQLQLITAQNGVASENFEQSIISLTEKIGEAATQGSEDFNRLGISVRDAEGNIKGTDTVLGELTNKFSTLSKAQQISFAQKLGIDNRVIQAFNKSDAELKKLTETANKFGVVTEAQTKQLDSYFASIETLRFGFTAVSRQVALNFAPVLESLSENVTDFLADFGSVFGLVFSEFFGGIGNLISGFNQLITATIGWKIAIIALGVAFAIAFPVSIIVAGVSLLLTVVEDLITAFKGGKSLFAEFFKDTFDIDIVMELTKAFDVWLGIFEGIKETISDIVGFIGTTGIFDAIGGLFGGSSIQPLTTLPTNNNSTNQTMNNAIKIEVTSNDPEAAGVAVSSALTRELEQANYQFTKDGGR